MKDPSIGILITCFNKESYIDDAIKSALKNTNQIIVIDDCSEDQSWEIIKKFKEIIFAYSSELRCWKSKTTYNDNFKYLVSSLITLIQLDL